MARLILDTTVLIDAERKGVTALEELVDDEDDAAIAALSVAELVVGVELADEKRRPGREAFLAALLDAVSVESYDLDVAQAHGALLAHTQRSGQPRGAHDLIIAATARARGREVVSADGGAFSGLPEVVVASRA
ncbi:MAG TPA: PIN domain-containing protein [Solirubrobacterales bacterium]|nr:PIN domain-containing protein [Solirubrobacterales bacterium]